MKKLLFNLILFILIPFLGAHAQSKNFSFFGSYNKGYGNIISKVSSDLQYPSKNEVEKLRTGTSNQFEIGAFYNHIGLGFIHNGYNKNTSTDFINTDFNGDGITDAGELSDNLKLNYNGIELLYKINTFTNKVDVIWKYAVGRQNYFIDKKTLLNKKIQTEVSVKQLMKKQLQPLYWVLKLITIYSRCSALELKFHIYQENSII